MPKFFKAIELGIEILGDVEALIAGKMATFSFSWHGKDFTVTINQDNVPK